MDIHSKITYYGFTIKITDSINFYYIAGRVHKSYAYFSKSH